MSTGKRAPGPPWRKAARALRAAGLACALASAPGASPRAQVSEDDRDFYLDEVLKGGTGSIQCLLRDSRGTLWVGSQAGLFSVREGALVRASGEDRAGMVSALLEAEGSVWAGGEKGLFRVGPEGMSRVPGAETRLVHALAAVAPDLWLGARNGLFRVQGGKIVHQGAGPGAVTALLADGGTLWVGGSRLARGGAGRLERVEGPETGWIRALARSGSELWIGGDRGVFRLADVGLAGVEGGRTGRVYALETAVGGRLWVGAFNGLFSVEDGRVAQRGSTGLKGVLALLADGEALWIGALRGLFRWQAGEVAPVPGAPTGWVKALLHDGQTLWIGAEQGLFRLVDGASVRLETAGPRSSGRPGSLSRPESAPAAPPPSAPGG